MQRRHARLSEEIDRKRKDGERERGTGEMKSEK
jgi:hypothetical protein